MLQRFITNNNVDQVKFNYLLDAHYFMGETRVVEEALNRFLKNQVHSFKLPEGVFALYYLFYILIGQTDKSDGEVESIMTSLMLDFHFPDYQFKY